VSEQPESPLLRAVVEAGGVVAEHHDRGLVRHFGDPSREYQAATKAAAVIDRSYRTRLTVSGRAPRQMLNGVLTGRMPTPPTRQTEGGVYSGVATYHAVLTPKGKMVTDLWVLLPGAEESPGFLLDVPAAGRVGLLEHLGKYLPPRFARITDVSAKTVMITVVGPDSPAALSRLALGLRVEPAALTGAAEGTWWRAGEADAALTVVRTMDVWPDAFSVLGPEGAIVALWKALVAEGVERAGLGVWSTLRVEAGRPLFGVDMDADTIPVEAGIDQRAIDHQKGCYTGQEVIVRIRDRGHVNRYLRRLELGDVPTPTRGAELYSVDDPDKVVGEVTSAVESPRYGGALALAYVRRGVEAVLLEGREIAIPADAATV
jgi:folate-binding protein YgfZ